MTEHDNGTQAVVDSHPGYSGTPKRFFVAKKRYSKYARDLREKGGRPLPMKAWVAEMAREDGAPNLSTNRWGQWLAAK
jgi:hypothetical protein